MPVQPTFNNKHPFTCIHCNVQPSNSTAAAAAVAAAATSCLYVCHLFAYSAIPLSNQQKYESPAVRPIYRNQTKTANCTIEKLSTSLKLPFSSQICAGGEDFSLAAFSDNSFHQRSGFFRRCLFHYYSLSQIFEPSPRRNIFCIASHF